jgi:hypothetical protein
MESQYQANQERKYHNVRVKKATFDALGKYTYENNLSLARCIEVAIERYCEDEGIELPGGKA